MSAFEAEFRAALSAAGLTTAAPLVADGKLHRFKADGDHAENSWYVLHADGMSAGAFGCWKRGISETWCSRPAADLNPLERAELERKWRDAQERRDAEQRERTQSARKAAVKIWEASPPAPADHPYLVNKGVALPGLRITGDALLVPLLDSQGILQSLQFINPDGTKRFLQNAPKRGLRFALGTLDSADRAYIAEGVATAASVHAATGLPVIAAMDAGNLDSVAQSVRQAFPALTLIFAADHDDPAASNVGVAKATAAARRVNGLIVYPATPGTDFNDVHQRAGLDAVRDRLALAAPPKTGPQPPARLERLRIEPGKLAELTDAAEMMLLKHHGNLYQRADQLVRVRIATPEAVKGVTIHAGTPVIAPVDSEYLVDQFNRLVGWEKFSERRHEWATSDAPRQVATALLSRVGDWKALPLAGLTTAPTLRPDGSLLDRPGYDAKTGLLFVDQGARFPTLPAAPSQAAGRAALDFLAKEVLAEFPFAAPHHRSVALSAILTALVRQSMPAAPLHAFTSPRASCGKSLLTDVVALIATGACATSLSFVPDQDELRKQLLSVLLGGASVTCLDNVEEVMTGKEICRVTSEATYTGRVLGTNTLVTVPVICTWLANGINLRFGNDFTRRVVLCEVDPNCERPEDRQCARDLRQWIPPNRPALVAAGLTALRAYIAAGRPEVGIKPLGSFEVWSALVRAALIWLGEADPLLGREEIEAFDPVKTKLRALILAWYHTFGTTPAICNHAVNRATSTYRDDNGDEIPEAPELKDVLTQHFTNQRGEPCSRVLGEFLKTTVKRVEVGARIEVSGQYNRATKWRVVPIHRPTLDKALQDFRQG